MAEYYPLLAKAVGSLSNSTPDTRRMVYERARKALIGQLRTLHPPVPEEDIDRESVALDRAIERLEGEVASGTLPPAPLPAPAPPLAGETGSSLAKPPVPAARPVSAIPVSAPPVSAPPPAATPVAPRPAPPRPAPRPAPLKPPPRPVPPKPTSGDAEPATGATGGDVIAPLRTKSPLAKTAAPVPEPLPAPDPVPLSDTTAAEELRRPRVEAGRVADVSRAEGQRPIAPLPPVAKGPKRRLWIVPLALVVVVAAVAVAAWQLRDRRETVARAKPAVEQQNAGDHGKIAERIGGAPAADATTASPTASANTAASSTQAPAPDAGTAPRPQADVAAPAVNPELPVTQRAALLVEAPEEQNKVKTFIGHVVWKLNNVSEGGPNDPVGLEVEADIDVPDDGLKAVITFEKNTDPSLPASHTIKVRFVTQPSSFTGDIQKINVPQLRPEAVATGEALVGVTVPVVTNSFLVGLAPGSAEATNLKLLKELQWIDIPMLLSNGKIAKLTFEKGPLGQRDLDEAMAAWAKG